MKQHITQEQLDEISHVQQLIYIKALHLDIPGTRLNLPDIGHLIWFLNEHLETAWWHINKSRYPNVWTIITKDNVGIEESDHEELIDALWKAVKEVLSREQPK